MRNDNADHKPEMKNANEKPNDKPTKTSDFLTQANETFAARMKVSPKDDGVDIRAAHPHPVVGPVVVMKAIGVPDYDFFNGLMSQLANASSRDGKPNEQELNYLLSVIKTNKPKDQNEVMLNSQMGVVHSACMNAAQVLANAKTDEQRESAVQNLCKLAKTYVALLDGLTRYRTGGETQVTVQNVSVSKGGQAVVGNVTQTRNENLQGKTATASPPSTDPKVTPITAHRRKHGAPK